MVKSLFLPLFDRKNEKVIQIIEEPINICSSKDFFLISTNDGKINL